MAGSIVAQNIATALGLAGGGTPVSPLGLNTGTVAMPKSAPAAPAKSSGTTNGNTTVVAAPAATVAAAPAYTDESGDIAMENSAINSAASSEQSGLNSINSSLNNILGEYNDDATAATSNYNTSSTQNEQDLQGNKEQALVDAAQGRQGLYSTLASLGALNGSGVDLANTAVQTGANSDLATAGDTYATNAAALDSSYGQFQTQNKDRIAEANAEAANDRINNQNATLKDEQTAYTDLANDYKAENNTAQYQNYAGLAAALYPQIATTNVPATNLAYTGSQYVNPALSSYTDTANNTAVGSTTPEDESTNANVPTLFAAPSMKLLQGAA